MLTGVVVEYCTTLVFQVQLIVVLHRYSRDSGRCKRAIDGECRTTFYSYALFAGAPTACSLALGCSCLVGRFGSFTTAGRWQGRGAELVTEKAFSS